jgi:hypothetical protein
VSTAIAVDAAQALEGLLRPGRDDLLGVGEARGLREAGARIHHEGAPAGGLGEPAERCREIDGAEHEQPRGRERDVDEEDAAALLDAVGALEPHQLVGGAGGGALQRLVAEGAVGLAVHRHEHLRALGRAVEDRDERAAAAAARELGEGSLGAHGW